MSPSKPPSGETLEKDKPGAMSGIQLPSSGLAHEILASLDQDTPADGPDRLYRFTDQMASIQEEEVEGTERFETWVTFRLGSETFGLPVEPVREVIRLESLTRVPHAPFPVRGITTLRGQIVPVVDLTRRLGLGEASIQPSSRLLVVTSRQRTLGLLVDAVHQVTRIAPSRIEAPPADVLTEQSDYILGVYETEPVSDDAPGGDLLILLDLEVVLMIRNPEAIDGTAGETSEESR